MSGLTEWHGSQCKNIEGEPLTLVQNVLEASDAVSHSNEVACFWSKHQCLSINFRSTTGNAGGGCIAVMLFVS